MGVLVADEDCEFVRVDVSANIVSDLRLKTMRPGSQSLRLGHVANQDGLG
jgi:hypothetical protein